MERILLKYNSLPIAAKAGMWFSICGLLQKGISFITTPIFTRLLTTEQYGVVSVYYSWEALISIICSLNLYYGGFNNGMRDYKDKRKYYLSSIQSLITLITVLWFVIYILGYRFWNEILNLTSALVLMMFIQILGLSALSLWSALERFEYHYRKVVAVTLVHTFFSAVLPIAMIWLFPYEKGAYARIFGTTIVTGLICGTVYIKNFKSGKAFYDNVIWRDALRFNIPLLPHYLSTMILNQADRIMISKMVGDSEAGIYSVAYSAAMVLNIFVSSINNSFAPWLYGKLDISNEKPIKKVANTLFFGVALIIVLVISFAPEFIYILGGHAYMEAIYIIPAVATSLYFIFAYQIFANIEFYYKKNHFITYASLIGAVLNIVLNYFGIKLFGYIAAGYTTLICYIVFGAAHFIFMIKICKKEKICTSLFDYKAIFSVALLLILYAVLMTCIYNQLYFRYVIIFAFLFWSLVNRKRILKNIRLS